VAYCISFVRFSVLVNGTSSGFFSSALGSRSGGAINISHLLFVDDTLIFCEANPDHFHDLCSLFL
jgi:hypothetical protein